MKDRIKTYVDMILSYDIEAQKLAISLLKTDIELLELLTPKENEELMMLLLKSFTDIERNQYVTNLNLLLIAMKLNNISFRISSDLIKESLKDLKLRLNEF